MVNTLNHGTKIDMNKIVEAESDKKGLESKSRTISNIIPITSEIKHIPVITRCRDKGNHKVIRGYEQLPILDVGTSLVSFLYSLCSVNEDLEPEWVRGDYGFPEDPFPVGQIFCAIRKLHSHGGGLHVMVEEEYTRRVFTLFNACYPRAGLSEVAQIAALTTEAFANQLHHEDEMSIIALIDPDQKTPYELAIDQLVKIEDDIPFE